MNVVAAAGLSVSLSAFALWKKALTPSGVILACFLGILITASGGVAAFSVLCATLLGTVAADRAAGKRADPHGVRRKTGSRDGRRVFCNVGVAAIAMGIYLISEDPVFKLAYYGVMAESLADSVASKLGPLSRQEPRDILTGKPVPAGLSGGVTAAGTASEIAGAAVIAILAGIGEMNWTAMIVVLLSGLAGAVADSVYGSAFQIKYICRKCGCVTEREEHCGFKTDPVSGFRFISNDTVNLLSNISAFVFAVLLSELLYGI